LTGTSRFHWFVANSSTTKIRPLASQKKADRKCQCLPIPIV